MEHMRKRCVIVGLGARATRYVDALTGPLSSVASVVGMCDPSPTRMHWHVNRVRERSENGLSVQMSPPEDFTRLIEATRAHVVVITSRDDTHASYIMRAAELGCDVICEKPMAIDAEQTRQVLAAIRSFNTRIRVTF